MNTIFRSFLYALNGVMHVVKTQKNMQRCIIVSIVVILTGILLQFTPLELVLLCIPITFMLVAEMLNTAAEVSMDFLTGQKYNPVVKLIKDITAGAVLVAFLGVGLCFTILFINRIPVGIIEWLSRWRYVIPGIGITLSFSVFIHILISHYRKR